MKRLFTITLLALIVARVAHAGAPAASIPTGGLVPQDVAAWQHGPNGRTMLAVVNAFSDNITLFDRQGDSYPFSLVATISLGRWPGTSTDLPRRVLATDLDHDGWMDLLVLNSGNYAVSEGGSLQALYARENGQWYVTPAWPIGGPTDFPTNIAIAESKRGGHAWVAVGFGNANRVGLYRHLGVGQFSSEALLPLTHTSPGLAWADLDGDTQPELAAAGGNVVSIIDVSNAAFPAGPIATVAYSITAPTGRSIFSIAAGDATADGVTDLVAVASQGTGQPGTLLLIDGPDATGPAPPPTEFGSLAWSSTLFTDIKAADCTGDGILDWMVSDRDNDVARMVIGPLGGTLASTTIYAGNGPRRVLVADVDRSGVPDLIAADENENRLTISYNYGSTPSDLDLSPLTSWDAPSQVPLSYRRLGLYSAFSDIATLIGDSDQNALVQLDAGGNEVDSLAYSALGLTVPAAAWGDDLGLNDELFVTSWGSNAIVKIESGIVVDTFVLSPAPSVPGLAGLAEASLEDALGSIERPQLWVLAPGARRLFGLDDVTGYLLETYSLALPFTAIAIDEDNEVAYLGLAEDLAVYRMPLTYAVTTPATVRLPLSAFTDDLDALGIGSLCWDNSPGLIVMATDQTIVGLGDPLISEPLSIQPTSYATGWNIVSISTHPTSGEVFAVDAGSPGQVLVFNGSTGVLVRRFGLQNARSGAYGDIRPDLIAIDATLGELIVAEGSSARAIRLNPTTGARLGEFTWQGTYADGIVGRPWKGLAIDPSGSQLLVLGQSSIVRSNRAGSIATIQASVPGTATSLALGPGDRLYYLDGAASRLVLTNYETSQKFNVVPLAPCAGGGLFGRRQLVAGSSVTDRILLIEPRTGKIEPMDWSLPSPATSWDLFD